MFWNFLLVGLGPGLRTRKKYRITEKLFVLRKYRENYHFTEIRKYGYFITLAPVVNVIKLRISDIGYSVPFETLDFWVHLFYSFTETTGLGSPVRKVRLG